MGAIVRRESLQGKGHVVRRMFADVEADIYVLVDGDDTYDAALLAFAVLTLAPLPRMASPNNWALAWGACCCCRRRSWPFGQNEARLAGSFRDAHDFGSRTAASPWGRSAIIM